MANKMAEFLVKSAIFGQNSPILGGEYFGKFSRLGGYFPNTPLESSLAIPEVHILVVYEIELYIKCAEILVSFKNIWFWKVKMKLILINNYSF